MDQEESKNEKETEERVRKARGEPESLPLKQAAGKAKSWLKAAFNVLHHVPEVNGMDEPTRLRAQADLKEIQMTVEKLKGTVGRLEKLIA